MRFTSVYSLTTTGDRSHLLQFDSANTASACIGRIAAEDREYTPFGSTGHASNSDRLVCGVCVSQRLAILANVMETHGIGGVVAGCLVSKEGLPWSPDTFSVVPRRVAGKTFPLP